MLLPPCVGILLLLLHPALWRPQLADVLPTDVLHKQLGRTTSPLTLVTQVTLTGQLSM